jgi:hypothetical protein
MACEKYENLLQAFFDQSLKKNEQIELKKHLECCSKCRLDFIMFKNVFQGLNELQDEELSCDVATSVKALIDAEPEHRPVSSIHRIVQPVAATFNYRWAMALAAVSIIAVIMFSGVFSHNTNSPAPMILASLDSTVSNTEALVINEMVTTNNDVKLLVDGSAVSILKSGTENWLTVSDEIALESGDKIKTDSSSRALLFYKDSGRLKVLPDTELQILAAGIRIKKGTTWIKIFKHGTDFSAYTPNAVAAVRGTVYTVQYSPEEMTTRVNLFSSHKPEGGVEVTTDLGSKLLPQGTFVDVTIDEITVPAPIEMETYLAFNQLPPEEVINNHNTVPATIGTESNSETSDSTLSTDDLPLSSDEKNAADKESYFDGIRAR